MSAIPAIIAEVRRKQSSFSLELRLSSGMVATYKFVEIKAGYLVVNNIRSPQDAQTTYIPFEAILSVRPVWP